MSKHEERLQKRIAQAGVASRRKAEQLILDGKVKVNHQVVTKLGTKVTQQDVIEVSGVQLENETKVYYLLYKPRGVISSVKDDKGRKTITDLLPEVEERIFPIGRLDYDTSGIILLTNDGDFANMLMHPSYGVEKVYVAKIKGIPDPTELKRIKKGIKDGQDLLKAVRYKILSTDRKKNTSILEITLVEGKNRHVRRMMEQLGYPVLKLKREKYAFLTVDGLKPGEFRKLTPKEVHQLQAQSGKNVKQ
ncbi:pseudouridine synthase [Virgibacillus sp. 179-BFC.A HS]|uniref:Pseudouridine synthase n=1 Tax=Tigheibacillus jepli TaxID=3035914 RepID=A0ABU5CJJ6_9BACI|nr:pseudouridine synthase [Virgibacillus sp. 179-BFC.A HS]MDY0405670.1 pseudouridine synthase [Virgibacillus sp. 179-BFC.A HS]